MPIDVFHLLFMLLGAPRHLLLLGLLRSLSTAICGRVLGGSENAWVENRLEFVGLPLRSELRVNSWRYFTNLVWPTFWW